MKPLVVITRPAAQAEALLQALEQQGIATLHQPTLDILPSEHAQALVNRLQQHQQRYALALFTSLNAVQQAAHLLDLPGWLQGKQVFAVGQATRSHLQQLGVSQVRVPRDQQTSEGLLALKALQTAPEGKAALFNAAGGRQHLQQTLRQRGFVVDEFHVYRRQPVSRPRAEFQQAVEAQLPLLLTVTSSAMLEALLTLVPASLQGWLQKQPLIVISPRMQQHAQALGFEHIHLARNASNDSLQAAVEDCLLQDQSTN